ncbi:uncharacterized protein TNCV_998321 [Trichonephila clavipes]|nr:uncharacterized protein TNCV_998321 [Trichonephila clavipes]
MQISPLLSELLHGIPATAHQNVWFMHDDAPTYFSIALSSYFRATYPDCFIGRGGLFAWPPSSLDLNSLDFFWDHLKSLAYETPIATGECPI